MLAPLLAATVLNQASFIDLFIFGVKDNWAFYNLVFFLLLQGSLQVLCSWGMSERGAL